MQAPIVVLDEEEEITFGPSGSSIFYFNYLYYI